MKKQNVVRKHRDREFRMDAARMIVEGGRTTGDVAKELGHSYQTVASWVRVYKETKSAPVLSSSELQLKLANEEIRKLKMQVDFLKKTMAYFVELPK